MKRNLIFIIGILAPPVAVGAGAVYGGTVYAAKQAATTSAAFFNGRGGAGTNAPAGAGPPQGSGGAGGLVSTANSAIVP